LEDFGFAASFFQEFLAEASLSVFWAFVVFDEVDELVQVYGVWRVF